MALQQKVIVGAGLKRLLPAVTEALLALQRASRAAVYVNVSSAFKKMVIFIGLAVRCRPANTKVFVDW
jgi:hypothetical protein